ncbi:hypothetical protein PWT90_10534 [Aphanocladium album]|nr:hypothetical protein PWT90_10534 [Aphanocladium album]
MFHQELRSENSEIRLIRRRASSNVTDGLDFEMTIVSLDKAPQYKAISYEWSDTAMQVAATVNGHTWYIAYNLYNVFMQVYAAPGGDSWLWVDALCVNQLNLGEKNWQVAHMHRIFSTAQSVFFCIGPVADHSDELFDFLIPWGEQATEAEMFPGRGSLYGMRIDPPTVTKRFVKTLITSESIFAKGLHQALNHLSHRTFWNRSWITQELILAKQGWVLCGTHAMPLFDFHSIMVALSQVCRWLEDKPRLGDGYVFNPCAVNMSMIGSDSNLRGYDAEKTLLWFLTTRATRVNSVTGQGPFYAARDPLDIIYAFLGIAVDRERLGIVPDYTKTVREAYTEATIAMLQRQRSKPILEHAAFPKDMYDLPSWVPDWHRIGRCGLYEPISHLDAFEVHGKPQGIPDAVIIDSFTLRRTGFVCGTVQAVFEFGAPADSVEEKATAFSEGLRRNRAGCIGMITSFLLQFTRIATEDSAQTRLWRIITADLYRDAERLQGYKSFSERLLRREPVTAAQLSAHDIDYIWEYAGPKEGERRQAVVDGFVRDAWEQAVQITRNRTLIATADGRIGLAPTAAKPGDTITALDGSNVLVILRQERTGYMYVGEAYVEGIMYGELKETETEREYAIFDLV